MDTNISGWSEADGLKISGELNGKKDNNKA